MNEPMNRRQNSDINKHHNEVIASSLASLTSSKASSKSIEICIEVEKIILRSNTWSASDVYILESLNNWKSCITNYYLSLPVRADARLRGSYIQKILNIIGRLGENSGLGSQQFYNTLPLIFSAFGLAAQDISLQSMIESSLFHNEQEKKEASYLNPDINISWQAHKGQQSILTKGETITFYASTVEQPDVYLRKFKDMGYTRCSIGINNINGYWGEAGLHDFVYNIDSLKLQNLYNIAHKIISDFLALKAIGLNNGLLKSSNIEAAIVWEKLFRGMVEDLKQLFYKYEVPINNIPLAIPDHSLLELYPTIKMLERREKQLREKCASTVIARHSLKNRLITTLWEKKAVSEGSIRLDYSVANNVLQDVNTASHITSWNVIDHDYIVNKVSGRNYYSLLIWPSEQSREQENTFSRFLVVCNGPIHAEESYFHINFSLSIFIEEIMQIVSHIRKKWSVERLSLRLRPGLDFQAKIVSEIMNRNTRSTLIKCSNQNTPLTDEIKHYDATIVFYPTTAIFEIADAGKPVLCIFRSKREISDFMMQLGDYTSIIPEGPSLREKTQNLR